MIRRAAKTCIHKGKGVGHFSNLNVQFLEQRSQEDPLKNIPSNRKDSEVVKSLIVAPTSPEPSPLPIELTTSTTEDHTRPIPTIVGTRIIEKVPIRMKNKLFIIGDDSIRGTGPLLQDDNTDGLSVVRGGHSFKNGLDNVESDLRQTSDTIIAVWTFSQ